MSVLKVTLLLFLTIFNTINHPPSSYTERRLAGVGDNLLHLRLKSSDGEAVHLSATKNFKATIFVFLSPECPLSQNYTLPLHTLHQKFGRQQVQFFAVVPGRHFPLREIKGFEKTYPLPCRILLDPDLALTKLLRASVTPEAVVVDAAGKTLYQGLIDNWAYALGKKRQVVTEHYLRDALENHLQGQPVAVRHTKLIGCLIETGGYE